MNAAMDELVEKAARAVCLTDDDSTHTPPCPDCLADATTALEAIGLPALLERVEAAEAEAEQRGKWVQAAKNTLATEREIMSYGAAYEKRHLKEVEDALLTVREMYETEHRDLLAALAEHDTLAAKVADALAAYEAKIQDFAVETWVVSEAHKWASTKDSRYSGDLADVGVDRGRLLAKEELLAVLKEARHTAPARPPLAEGVTESQSVSESATIRAVLAEGTKP